MRSRLGRTLQREAVRLRRAVRGMDPQVATVLLLTPVLLIVQFSLGSRRLFHDTLAAQFVPEWQGVLGWGWWFGMQGVTGFVIPAFVLLVLFRRRPAEVGLGRGDVRLAVRLTLLYLPLAAVGTWVLSDGAAFQRAYPHYTPAAYDWTLFLAFEAMFLVYWVGWEYLWRGFLLFGTAPVFGPYAILVQTVPFAILHLDKPVAEAFLSVLGGVALGALVWRCRAVWVAVPIHAAQMLFLDTWCALRLRTGVEGVGVEALWRVFGG